MRPKKTTVEYFPHKTNSGRTIFILERLYGNNGYAAWFKILEILGSSPGHFYDFNSPANFQYLSAKIGVSGPETTEILNTLSGLDAIDPDLHAKGIIWSDNFVANLDAVYAKRGGGLPEKPGLRHGNSTISMVSGPETIVSVTETPRREGKGREVKEREEKKEKNRCKKNGNDAFDYDSINPMIRREVVDAFIEHRKKLKKPFTPYALKLACADAMKCFEMYEIDPNAAIERAIVSGWQSCNPKYFERETARQGMPRANTVRDALTIQGEQIARALNDEQRQQQHVGFDDGQAGGVLLEHQV